MPTFSTRKLQDFKTIKMKLIKTLIYLFNNRLLGLIIFEHVITKVVERKIAFKVHLITINA